MENVVILGTGMAGLTAAVYTARASLSPLVLGGPEDGGQLGLTTDVENFPAFPEGVQGPELIAMAKKQAERFGARIKQAAAVRFERKGNNFALTLDDDSTIDARAVIVATGASARWLGIESEKKYRGRGVTTCATCDGALFRGKEVVVVGGGDSAMEESIFLTKFCTKVTIIHRRDAFRASRILRDRALKNPRIKVRWNSVIEEVLGDGKKVTGVRLKDTKSGKAADFKTDGVFLAIGHIPNTKIFEGILKLDGNGYLKIDSRMRTNMPGVFGAGDVHDTVYRQAVTAAGAGCAAAIEAEKYLESLEA